MPYYVVDAPEEAREGLAVLLREAVVRLGPYAEDADLRDPAFMAVHASNLIEPVNYRDVEIPLPDGRTALGRQYSSPEAERIHFERLQQAGSEQSNAAAMQLAIAAALDDPSRSSEDFAQRAVEWAQTATPPLADENSASDLEIHEQAIVGSAMLAMRDGTPGLRDAHRVWAQEVFATTLRAEDDPVHRVRNGLKFNPVGIAFAGLAYALGGNFTSNGIRELLSVVGRPAAAHGFIAATPTLAAIDDRLPRSILRCVLAACILPVGRWEEPEEEQAARLKRHHQAVTAAVAAEIAWLFEGGDEPTWQAPPVYRPRSLGPADAEATAERFDYQAAALWLRGASRQFDVGGGAWLQSVLRSHADWTWAANGSGLQAAEDLSQTPNEWNDVYFSLLARGLAGADEATADRLALAPLASLPDKSFFDVVTRFQGSVDEVFFNNLGLETSVAVHIRSRLAERLKSSNRWTWFVRNRSSSMEVRLGSAIAALFFNQYGYFSPMKAYLLPPAIDGLMPFLPILKDLAIEGSSLFVASLTLNLLEVSPRSAHLPFLLTVAEAWMAAFPNATDFWVNHAVGRRVCGLIEAARREEPGLLGVNQPLRDQTNRLLPALIRLGVAEAARLEQALMESD